MSNSPTTVSNPHISFPFLLFYSFTFLLFIFYFFTPLLFYFYMKFLPDDLSAEALLAYLPEGACKVSVQGLHQRNTYKDILGMEPIPGNEDCMLLQLSRNSLYTALPEALFHQVDRFSNLPAQHEKERFAEEYEEQEKEKELARKFFMPLDLRLLSLRVDVYKRIAELSQYNRVLENMLADQLTEKQRNNRFISQLIHFLPACKTIRGNRTLLTLMLRKVLVEERLKIEVVEKVVKCDDASPRYDDCVGGVLGEGFLGNEYEDSVVCYQIQYWPEGQCDEHFMALMDELEEMRAFVQDYFLSVEETLHFEVSYDDVPLRLSDDLAFNYLNYNANL